MIRLIGGNLPKNVFVACSGGVDSMAALAFLTGNPRRKVVAAFFNHGTKTSEQAQAFLESYLPRRFPSVKLVCSHIGDATKQPEQSPEEFWRTERYKFLHGLKAPVVMAHHLDDCVENWIFTSLHGDPKVIPYKNRNVIRPFLLTKKSEMIDWCQSKDVQWVEDESNKCCDYARNRIRHNILPEILKLNPGIHKVIRRKVEERSVL